jgi:hypothetical protein
MISIARWRKYSQRSQDGIIASVFDAIGTTNKECVEFGFNSKSLIGGSGPNCGRLVVDEDWHGTFFDSEYDNIDINLHQVTLTPENLAKTFELHDISHVPDYISIDVDGPDLWLMAAMLEAEYTPRLISCEYNANFPADVSATVTKDTSWNNDAVYGASLAALCKLAHAYNYQLICVEPGYDAFFMPHNLVPLLYHECCSRSMHNMPTSERCKQLIEYPSLEPLEELPWPDLRG